MQHAHIGKKVNPKHVEAEIVGLLRSTEDLVGVFYGESQLKQKPGLLWAAAAGLGIADYLVITTERVITLSRGIAGSTATAYQLRDVVGVSANKGWVSGEIILNIQSAGLSMLSLPQAFKKMVPADVPIADELLQQLLNAR